MWQTLLLVTVLGGAAVYLIRHFMNIYRTGSDCTCSGCSSGCCAGKPAAPSRTCCAEGGKAEGDASL